DVSFLATLPPAWLEGLDGPGRPPLFSGELHGLLEVEALLVLNDSNRITLATASEAGDALRVLVDNSRLDAVSVERALHLRAAWAHESWELEAVVCEHGYYRWLILGVHPTH